MEQQNPDHIYPPWTEQQVDNLNHYQQNGRFHPFTCGGCDRSTAPHEGLLIATEEGWVCGCGKYTQFWAWKFMAE